MKSKFRQNCLCEKFKSCVKFPVVHVLYFGLKEYFLMLVVLRNNDVFLTFPRDPRRQLGYVFKLNFPFFSLGRALQAG